ncbi:MAG TPA: HAMP domain-containing sensor histidine kinase [Thermomonas sp.]|nr:HAMP domain-containing sensor histidine kinase [Thermomonas sp.]
MNLGTILLAELAAVFAVTGILFIMVWSRDPVREHLWFGCGSLAAAGALAAHGMQPYLGVPAVAAAQRISDAFCLMWLLAMGWFCVEYARAGVAARRLAALVTIVLTVVLAAELALAGSTRSLPFLDRLRTPDLFADLALLGVGVLVLTGTLRLWRTRERFRAVVLGAGMGATLLQVALPGLLPTPGPDPLPSPLPVALLAMVVLLAYELGRGAHATQPPFDVHAQGFEHTSRLAIVGELTASIAHEINQPLGAILSNTEAGEILLERENPPLDYLGHILQDIRRDGLRASNVIRQVRTLARNQEFTLEELDANSLLEDVIGLLAAEANKRRIRFDPSPSSTPASLRGDRVRLQQVLINLMLNAMDAMETGTATDSSAGTPSSIVLGVAHTSSGEIEIRIVDSGSGIPADRIGKLFDSFYTSKAHGMGLGLSIARSIVEAHGGRIRAENNAGGGATFRVTFPPVH